MLSAKKKRSSSRSKDEALSEVAREETTRLNAIVPVSLHRRVKLQAAREGKSITEILITSLETYMRRHADE